MDGHGWAWMGMDGVEAIGVWMMAWSSFAAPALLTSQPNGTVYIHRYSPWRSGYPRSAAPNLPIQIVYRLEHTGTAVGAAAHTCCWCNVPPPVPCLSLDSACPAVLTPPVLCSDHRPLTAGDWRLATGHNARRRCQKRRELRACPSILPTPPRYRPSALVSRSNPSDAVAHLGEPAQLFLSEPSADAATPESTALVVMPVAVLGTRRSSPPPDRCPRCDRTLRPPSCRPSRGMTLPRLLHHPTSRHHETKQASSRESLQSTVPCRPSFIVGTACHNLAACARPPILPPGAVACNVEQAEKALG